MLADERRADVVGVGAYRAGLIIAGLSFERFGMSLLSFPNGPWPTIGYTNPISTWIGIALVAIGVAASLAAGLRFYAVASAYRRKY